eukprot:4244744-Karenia_brevis.AAC.1
MPTQESLPCHASPPLDAIAGPQKDFNSQEQGHTLCGLLPKQGSLSCHASPQDAIAEQRGSSMREGRAVAAGIAATNED